MHTKKSKELALPVVDEEGSSDNQPMPISTEAAASATAPDEQRRAAIPGEQWRSLTKEAGGAGLC